MLLATCRSHAGHSTITNANDKWYFSHELHTVVHESYLCIYAVHMSLALHKSSALQHFKRGNAFEIHNGIMFDFYLGLLHILPYSGKFSQGRNFRNFCDQMPAHENLFLRKFFLPKISCWWGSQEQCVWAADPVNWQKICCRTIEQTAEIFHDLCSTRLSSPQLQID